ncbi:MAG: 16S rRNA (cytosine(967)-C(5))-methyltransferase RsmB [Gammaproteobacteria bacterium]
MGAEGTAPRVAAVRALAAVLGEGRSLSAAMAPVLGPLAGADRALTQELCYGVLRWHPQLQALAGALLRKPLKRRDLDVQCLVLVGLYQLIHLRTPDYAAVAETVEAARALGRSWAAGLVNGVLRNFLRQRQQLEQALAGDEAAVFAHPGWLLRRLRDDWPQHWRAIVDANNARPPMVLRVNLAHQSRDAYAGRLAAAGLTAVPVAGVASALCLEAPVDVQRLPGFDVGDVSVQDGAAQLAAWLLEAGPGMRVLDACAAPGGKTGHILEQQPRLQRLVALDVDRDRLQQVRENLDRLGLAADLVAGDAGRPDAWWDGRGFDRILLDAPCSATGVIRRHPDIKALRRAKDIDALAAQQRRILEALWPLLVPGGMLLYATCSILRAENAQQVERFLRDHSDAYERRIEAGWGHAGAHGLQLLPGENGMDGFFYARLDKCG